ncbi:hypothetical protein ATN84_14690 [Paramesorhizobium deserti]|uniref:HhH-GPD domain-containing protein n=1 Tax=Paramesorhizobium deserti TaxID=1494590 RepID=A0A135HSH8_9HYPH|nr:hypothetical protein [Paramesorhizobium deserti]KXF76148.1 hypothetical protein ATN84_14690 [Paramesorhizobium deserti]
MQLHLPIEAPQPVEAVHRQLAQTFGRPPERPRLDPASQFIRGMLSVRTHGEVSRDVFQRLQQRFPNWKGLEGASFNEMWNLIADITLAEKYARYIPQAVRNIISLRGAFDLDFLHDWPVRSAMQWLERLPGVGVKIAASTLNFSTLQKRVLVIDTHHLRIAKRLGLVGPPASIEEAYPVLERQLPDNWDAGALEEHHWLMKRLGQTICTARAPSCGQCPLKNLCAYAKAG